MIDGKLCFPFGHKRQLPSYYLSEIIVSKIILFVLFNFRKRLIILLNLVVKMDVVRQTPLL